MRNRQLILGRPLQLSRKQGVIPDHFAAWLHEAAVLGDLFAPNIIELPRRKLHREFQDIRQRYTQLCKCPGVYHALVGMFYFSLAETILANPDEERWLEQRAIVYSITAQHHMVQAWLQLPEQGRRIYLSCAKRAGIDAALWRQRCAGTLAEARFAYACLTLGISVRLARADHDMYRKIDLFCETPYFGDPSLCVQIKSDSMLEGMRLQLLTEAPTLTSCDDQQGLVAQRLWKGVQRFNADFCFSAVPLLAHVGGSGISPDQIDDLRLLQELRIFFSTLPEQLCVNDSEPALDLQIA